MRTAVFGSPSCVSYDTHETPCAAEAWEMLNLDAEPGSAQTLLERAIVPGQPVSQHAVECECGVDRGHAAIQ